MERIDPYTYKDYIVNELIESGLYTHVLSHKSLDEKEKFIKELKDRWFKYLSLNVSVDTLSTVLSITINILYKNRNWTDIQIKNLCNHLNYDSLYKDKTWYISFKCK